MVNIDLRIKQVDNLVTPAQLFEKFPVSQALARQVKQNREAVNRIIRGEDQRLLAIVGPCSIHDINSAMDYAAKLNTLAKECSDVMQIVMRAYFEKPRTVFGWKGLVMDPLLDNSCNIGLGLELARSLLISINSMGLAVGCELLDPIIPQYIDDLFSWVSIGARTSESQVHRSLASGLSTAVGFKNSTGGEFSVAVNAIKAATYPASFIGITRDGQDAVFRTKGNDCCHLILRGGDKSPNYYEEDVKHAVSMMKESGLNPSIMIDCSHGNSQRDPSRQSRVLRNAIEQFALGQKAIRGFMLESNIYEGSQELVFGCKPAYGISVTDPCMGWDETSQVLKEAAESLRRIHV